MIINFYKPELNGEDLILTGSSRVALDKIVVQSDDYYSIPISSIDKVLIKRNKIIASSNNKLWIVFIALAGFFGISAILMLFYELMAAIQGAFSYPVLIIGLSLLVPVAIFLPLGLIAFKKYRKNKVPKVSEYVSIDVLNVRSELLFSGCIDCEYDDAVNLVNSIRKMQK